MTQIRGMGQHTFIVEHQFLLWLNWNCTNAEVGGERWDGEGAEGEIIK